MKYDFPDLRGMSPEQKNNEITLLRKFWAKNQPKPVSSFMRKVWSFIDRVFRWKIMLVRVKNPLLMGDNVVSCSKCGNPVELHFNDMKFKREGECPNCAEFLSLEPRQQEFLFFQELTDNPYFTFEKLIDHTIMRLNKHVLSVAGREAEGYIFETDTGMYEITIKKFKG